MKTLFQIVSAIFLCVSVPLVGQPVISGDVYDNETKEPLIGATVCFRSGKSGTVTNVNGQFSLPASDTRDTLEISYIGYARYVVADPSAKVTVALTPSVHNLQQIMVTANREAALRTESPVAISKLSPAIIADTKPVLITELVNKVPGVVMVNYNNEQHAMAIRQPMGTSAYFLYMEDGLPVRPMGIFNHNALIEMNVFGISSIEVIKGPASSLYGPEAVGGAINFITHRATAMPTAKLGLQADQWGYRRMQYAAGGTAGKKVGVYVSGFEARQRDAWQTYSDYTKSSVNARIDFQADNKTTLTAAFSGNDYHSDMPGSVDSAAFYARSYTSTTDFTYRKVQSQRTRFTVLRQWNNNHESTLTLAYRDNYIEQNPNYGIRWTKGSETASGERNRSSFHSRVALLQHRIKFNFLDAKLLTGTSFDYSPTRYWSYKIDLAAELRPDGKSVERYSIVQERPDIFLADYKANLRNYAAYTQFEISPVERLNVTLGVRYDRMGFNYLNHLDGSTGDRSYQQVTPKIGATFDLLDDRGLYINYSRGFSPPGLTSIFRKRSTPGPDGSQFYYGLQPAHFDNVEAGGWAAFADNKIYLDVAVYQMKGHNELLNIRQPDNSVDYQSAGRTLHRGIEYGLTFKPNTEWFFRFGGTNAVHKFEDFELSTRDGDKIKHVNGNDMPQAPPWIANSELVYKPDYVKGLRVSLEWQRIGSWHQDQVNSTKYNDKGLFGLRGASYLNLRTGYQLKGFEIFANIINLTDELFANAATKGNAVSDRTTYTPAAPRTVVLGIQYLFTGKTTQSL